MLLWVHKLRVYTRTQKFLKQNDQPADENSELSEDELELSEDEVWSSLLSEECCIPSSSSVERSTLLDSNFLEYNKKESK